MRRRASFSLRVSSWELVPSFIVVYEAVLVFLQVVSTTNGEGACGSDGADGGGIAGVFEEQGFKAVG